MLKQRVITALVLLAILLPALFYATPTPFNVLALILLAAGAWEWGRMNGLNFAASVVLALVCGVAGALSWYGGLLEQSLSLLWSISGAAWVLGGSWLLRVGVKGWPGVARPIRLAGGVFVLWLAWLAMAQARVIGTEFLLSILLLVWVADVFAYFVGRALGGKFSKSRLAPSISPGKSWEGVWGGMLGIVAMALLWNAFGGASLYSRLSEHHGLIVMILAVIFLATMSVVGDLVESLVKRSAGVKDSSRLLPGHGGVLDRVDALLPTLPLAMMLASLPF